MKAISTMPELVTSGLSKQYASGSGVVRAVEDVNLSVQSGEIVAIVGPSGSGKSTLLNLMAGFEKPSRGSIQHAGVELTVLPEAQLADHRLRSFGFVFQNYNLIPILTAQENVEFPLALAGAPRLERSKRARLLLERVGLAARAMHRPSQLSGGEQQRVAIARALVTNPGVVFADEPTGNLDSQTGREILDLLTTPEQGNRTVIIITHDLEIAQRADRIVRIRDGRVEAI